MKRTKKAVIAAALAGLMLATSTPADAHSVWNHRRYWRWHPCYEETYVGSSWGYGYNVFETDLVCSWGGRYVLKIVMPDGTVLIDNTSIFFPNGYTPSHK